jgi:hypothetical protein
MESNTVSSLDAAADLTMRWHVPHERHLTLRFKLIRLACMTIIFATIVFLITDPEQHLAALGSILTLALLMAAWQIFRTATKPMRPPNVWLDNQGFHWLTPEGREHLLEREKIVNYWLGFDEQTHRALPSLTFLLPNNFLSQPIEMHPPVDATQLQTWFREHWNLTGVEHLPEPHRIVVPLHTEYDEAKQTWLFQGNQEQLMLLAQAWREIAEQYPLPPLGARPQEVYLDFGESAGMMVCVAPQTWIEFGIFSTPPARLQELAAFIDQQLPEQASERELSFTSDSGHRWRFIFRLT